MVRELQSNAIEDIPQFHNLLNLVNRCLTLFHVPYACPDRLVFASGSRNSDRQPNFELKAFQIMFNNVIDIIPGTLDQIVDKGMGAMIEVVFNGFMAGSALASPGLFESDTVCWYMLVRPSRRNWKEPDNVSDITIFGFAFAVHVARHAEDIKA